MNLESVPEVQASQTFTWYIAHVSLVNPGPQSSIDGANVSLQLQSHDADGDPLSYSASGLPSGLYFDSPATAGSFRTDTTTQGNWQNVYGSDGYNVIEDAASYPSYATVGVTGNNNYVWSSSTTDPRALQEVGGGSRIAACWYSHSNFTINVNFTDGQSHQLALYLLDWDNLGRNEQVQITDATTGTILDTESASNFSTGEYLVWKVSGDINIKITNLNSTGNAEVSGLFFDPPLQPGAGLISGTIASNADTNSPYNVTVTASDGHGNSTTQTFLWTVSHVALSLPSDQTNTEGDNVSLQLQGAKSSGTLTYNASGLPSGLSVNTTSGLISGTVAAGDAAAGPYTVDVSATNGSVSTSQNFIWNVNPVVNLTTPADQNNNVGDNVSLQISATDSLNKTLSYSASDLPSGLSINSSTGLISGKITSGDSSGGPYVVTVTASDGTYSSSTSFNWNGTDTSPLTMTVPGTQTNVASDSVNVQVTASDPDGDVLTYTACDLPDGLEIDPFTGLISGTIAEEAPDPVPYQATVTATDGNGHSVSQTFTWIVNPPPIVAQGKPITAIEGIDPGSFTVATFTTPDMNSLADDFGATINYGDGTTDSGVISDSNGSFTVTGDHLYDEKGSYPVGVTIFDALTGGCITTSTTATVTDAALTMTGGYEYGDSYTDSQSGYVVATFTDDNPDAPQSPFSDYSVNINWGDGNYTNGTAGQYVTGLGDGLYEIVAQHAYANLYPQPGPWTYTVTVTLTDVDGASAQVTDTVVVGAITADVPATMGEWAFVDQNTLAPSNDFVYNGQTGVALINWGDGTSSLGTVSGSNGYFNIQAAPHTYMQDSMDQPNGLYTITVTVTDDDGNTLTGTQYVSVMRPEENLVVGNVDIPSNLTVSNAQVAAFTVPDTNDDASEFTAQINWGDGNISSGTIQEVAPGLFNVLGTHTYATYDWYTITVTLSQGWGSMEADAEGAGLAGGKPVINIVPASSTPENLDKLYVSNWEGAFERVNEGRMPPQVRVLSNFIRTDPRRFFINVKDPAANKSDQVKDTIKVHITTSSETQGDDVTLTETGRNTSEFRSSYLLLTSDDIDTQYVNTTLNKYAAFLVKLGDTVRAAYDGKTDTCTVPIQKVVNLRIYTLSVTKGSDPVESKEGAEFDVESANKIYAPTGILFKSRIAAANPPPNVDLSNGLYVGLLGPKYVPGGKLPLSPEEKNLLDHFEPLGPENKSYILVLYVNYFTNEDNLESNLGGYALIASLVPARKYADTVMISAKHDFYSLLAHEVGHVLLDLNGHVDKSVRANKVSLMTTPLDEKLLVTDSRRITFEQAQDMVSKRPNLLSNP